MTNNHKQRNELSLCLAFCLVTVVLIMAASGSILITMVYAAHHGGKSSSSTSSTTSSSNPSSPGLPITITPEMDTCIKTVVGTEITVATVGVVDLPPSQVPSNNNDITNKAVAAIEGCITNPSTGNNMQNTTLGSSNVLLK